MTPLLFAVGSIVWTLVQVACFVLVQLYHVACWIGASLFVASIVCDPIRRWIGPTRD